jgi:hypothetical protein
MPGTLPRVASPIAKNHCSKRKRWLVAGICLGICFSLISCAAQNYGRLQPSPEITRMFEDERVLTDYVYYYSGLQGVPDAIIGVHPDYSLSSDSWRQFDLTPLTLEKWVFRMRIVSLISPQGAWILGPQGNRIGIWFSSQNQTPVRLEENNRLVVVPPGPTQLQEIR